MESQETGRETELSKSIQAQQLMIEHLGECVREIEVRLVAVLGPPIPKKEIIDGEAKPSHLQQPLLLKVFDAHTTQIINITAILEGIAARLVC